MGTEEYIAPEVIKGCGHSSAVDWWTTGILIYEMMYGTTPFKGPSRHATFSNVLRQEPAFPETPAVSTLGKSCVRKLLTKNEHKRLGCQSGASEVKHHKWFSPIVWGLLRHSKPPIVPAASVCSLFFPQCYRRSLTESFFPRTASIPSTSGTCESRHRSTLTPTSKLRQGHLGLMRRRLGARMRMDGTIRLPTLLKSSTA